MNASKLNLPHLLSNNTSHGVNGLCEDTQPGGEIWNCDPIASTKKNHHGLANHPTKPE